MWNTVWIILNGVGLQGDFEQGSTSMTADFFRNRLDQMIDLRHPLAVLSNRMPWQELETSFAHRFARQVRAGKRVEDVDLLALRCRWLALEWPRQAGLVCRPG